MFSRGPIFSHFKLMNSDILNFNMNVLYGLEQRTYPIFLSLLVLPDDR